jgi:mycobactin peptide synthetase MbtE
VRGEGSLEAQADEVASIGKFMAICWHMLANLRGGLAVLPDPRWTTGRPSSASEGGLHEAVAAVARRRPEAVALVFEGRRISYAELDGTADAWAASLARAGVGRGDVVPIRLPRGPELVIALLAVLKTGAAYALLDVAWSSARVRDVVATLGAKLVIDDVDAVGWTPGDAQRTDFTPATVDGADPCCVFFTSGTTGEPKGVLTTHRATARLFGDGAGAGGFAHFDENTVMPLAAPVVWDAFSLELWAVLLSGGTSLIVPEPALSAGALRAGVARHGVDSIWLTSSLFNQIVDEDTAAFTGVRQVLVGGERLSPAHVARFLRAHPDIALHNGYGPVESVVFATTHRVTAADTARSDGIPIGRPVPGTTIHVLDGDRPCAIGAPGEICVSGDGLALHYLGDPGLTADRFAEIRLAGRKVRVYRTGDLGVWGANGVLRYLGRADRQVKIRGHRVEPAGVERQIEQLAAVHRCRIVPRRDTSGNAVDLVAFCTPAEPGAPLDTEIDALGSTMDPHHRPAAVVPVREFPLTPQGKLNERALLDLLPAAAETVPRARLATRTRRAIPVPRPRTAPQPVAQR